MKKSLKPILVFGALALAALSVYAVNDYYTLDKYGRSLEGPPFMKKAPPWIPGTNGQNTVRVQVLDATTLEPIEGAIVVGGYYGNGRRGVECLRSESAISDAEGWATLPNDQDERVHGPRPGLMGPWLKSAYKRGYQLAQPPRYAVAGGNAVWYIRETTPVPYYRPGFVDEYRVISVQKFSRSHKATLLETKERSRIYMMPSTAETKEERSGELSSMDGGSCGFTMPFKFSESEGALAAWRAIYQEKLDIGFNPLYDKDMLDRYEKSYLDFRQGFYMERR